jgi:hypothetical protein
MGGKLSLFWVWAWVWVFACVDGFTLVDLSQSVPVFALKPGHTHMCACTHIHTLTHTNTYTHIFKHTRIHTHT